MGQKNLRIPPLRNFPVIIMEDLISSLIISPSQHSPGNEEKVNSLSSHPPMSLPLLTKIPLPHPPPPSPADLFSPHLPFVLHKLHAKSPFRSFPSPNSRIPSQPVHPNLPYLIKHPPTLLLPNLLRSHNTSQLASLTLPCRCI